MLLKAGHHSSGQPEGAPAVFNCKDAAGLADALFTRSCGFSVSCCCAAWRPRRLLLWPPLLASSVCVHPLHPGSSKQIACTLPACLPRSRRMGSRESGAAAAPAPSCCTAGATWAGMGTALIWGQLKRVRCAVLCWAVLGCAGLGWVGLCCLHFSVPSAVGRAPRR